MEKQVLKEKQFKFNKSFGQNFIFDKNLLAAIVKDANITKNDDVLEIGPGAGTLTKMIATSARKVVSFEIDKNLQGVLCETLKGVNNSTIVFEDALKASIESIEIHFENNYQIVANLPYYITTPLIFKFIEKTNKVSKITVMVQKEVGERFTCKSGSKMYGAVTVMLDFYGDVCVKRKVLRHMFTPAPKVDSCIVEITLKNKFDVDKNLFSKVVHTSFAMRRKTLANNLKNLNLTSNQIQSVLTDCNLELSIRAEMLTTKQFVDLTKCIEKVLN